MANHVFLYAFNTATPLATPGYPLFYLAILDSRTTLYIFNNLACFYNLQKAPRDHFIVAGNSQIAILAYGDVNITVKSPTGPRTLQLRDVAYCTGFQCNLVSFDKLRQHGYYWDTRKDLLLRENDTVLCQLDTIKGQRVLEHKPLPVNAPHSYKSAFVITR